MASCTKQFSITVEEAEACDFLEDTEWGAPSIFTGGTGEASASGSGNSFAASISNSGGFPYGTAVAEIIGTASYTGASLECCVNVAVVGESTIFARWSIEVYYDGGTLLLTAATPGSHPFLIPESLTAKTISFTVYLTSGPFSGNFSISLSGTLGGCA